MSQYMCCACGGGSPTPGVVSAVPFCVDTNDGLFDELGDNCDSYSTLDDNCGSYDQESGFVASEMCCGCGGGKLQFPSGATCTDTDGDIVDEHFDGCHWYIPNTDLCGEYDTSDFTASLMCCSCGGGLHSEKEATLENEEDSSEEIALPPHKDEPTDEVVVLTEKLTSIPNLQSPTN